MVEGRIVVWDLFINLTSNLDLVKELDKMRCVVPALLYHGGIFILKPNLPKTRWPLYRIHDAPQQMGSGDCEIHCYKYFKYGVTHFSF